VRIAFYAPLKPPDHPVASGDRTMGRALLEALRLAGHEAEIVCHFRSFDSGDPGRQAKLRRVGQRLAEKLAGRLERRGKPDLWFTYHLYHKAPDWLGPVVAERLGLPYVVAETSFAPKQAGGRWDIGHRGVAEAVYRAEAVFQLNPADVECVAPLLASPDRLKPLSPFLDTRPFQGAAEARDRRAIAERYGIDPAEPWLLAVGMMRADQKLRSYRCLAEALSGVTDLPWRLLVVGGGPAEDEVRTAFASLGPRVTWLGVADEKALPALYAAADLYVWPAVKEAWSMAFLEAQAAGLPVVAGRSGGVPSVVGDGETGLIVPEGDAKAFGQAVRLLLQDPDRRREMGRAAQRRAIDRHDRTSAAAVLDQALQALVPRAAGR
jgi:glycosyltransferase involved in cell wall biosynthesis